MADLLIGPALFLGAIIGLYEVFLIHRDVMPFHRLKHAVHAFALTILFCFISMNTAFVLDILPFLQNIPIIGNVHILRVAVGVIAAAKIHLVSKTLERKGHIPGGSRKLQETWFHSLLIGALIVAAPYVYPLIEGVLPAWVKF